MITITNPCVTQNRPSVERTLLSTIGVSCLVFRTTKTTQSWRLAILDRDYIENNDMDNSDVDADNNGVDVGEDDGEDAVAADENKNGVVNDDGDVGGSDDVGDDDVILRW